MLRPGPATILLIGALLSSSAAGTPGDSFPLRVVDSGAAGILMEPVGDDIDALQTKSQVLFEDVTVAPGLTVDLELSRVSIVRRGAPLVVDGVTQWMSQIDDGLTMWTGSVVGDPNSSVYLAFSRHGSRGFVRTAGEYVGLVAAPRSGDDWSETRSTFAVSDPNAPGPMLPDQYCASEQIQQFPTLPNDAPPTPKGPGSPSFAMAPAVTPIYEAEIALECDYQFYQIFNNLNATRTYAVTLFGAVSDRYREQVGVIFTMPYLGLYTSNNDPWTEQDTGGNCVDVLYQFQAYWSGGGAPVSADLYHMYSGANLGCGVAWLDVLCNQNYGFSVCGNMGGNTQFPVQQGNSGNWDFVVSAHELGHNFATPHTHDFCPPVDQCAPSGYFGQCQNQQVCINYGTVMSYCHLCSGGLNNITTYFHATPLNVMRNAVENSCLNLFKGISDYTDLGYSLLGSGGDPELVVSFDSGASTLDFDIIKAPSNKTGLLILSPNTWYLPLKGGTLVPQLDVLVGVSSNLFGMASYSGYISGAVSLPSGDYFYAQTWFGDPTGPNRAAATNAVEFEFIAP